MISTKKLLLKTAQAVGAVKTDVKSVKTAMDTLADKVYPVGSIYMSVNSESPATLFGGTWERIGIGRTLVSAGGGTGAVIDSNTTTTRGSYTGQAEWYPCGERGGEQDHQLTISEMPKHTHRMGDNLWSDGTGSSQAYTMASGRKTTNRYVLSSGEGAFHNTVQPYLAVYMWKRTA